MGSFVLRSTTTKATRNTTVKTRGTMVAGLPHPQSGEKVSGTNRATSAAPSSTAPAQSMRAFAARAARRSRPSARRSAQPARMVAVAMGTLMKKIQRQLWLLTMSPPITGPSVRPKYTAVTFRPRALPRC